MYTFEEMIELEGMNYGTLPKTKSAKKTLETKISNEVYILTQKQDGFRYTASKDKNGIMKLTSRTRSRVDGNFVEKQDNVPHIMKALSVIMPNESIIVGEICFYNQFDKTSKDVTKIMGALPEKATKRQQDSEQFLSYYIFDVLMWDGVDYAEKPYEQRLGKVLEEFDYSYLNLHYAEYKEINYLVPVDYVKPNKDTDVILDIVQQWLGAGAEGGVLMDRTKPYAFGKRPAWTSIKIKQEINETVDMIITGFVSPTREYYGEHLVSHPYWENVKNGTKTDKNMYGKAGWQAITKAYYNGWYMGFEYGVYYGDKILYIGTVSGISDGLKKDSAENPSKYISKVIELNAMSIDKEARTLRHPRFIQVREDKPATDCKFEDVFE